MANNGFCCDPATEFGVLQINKRFVCGTVDSRYACGGSCDPDAELCSPGDPNACGFDPDNCIEAFCCTPGAGGYTATKTFNFHTTGTGGKIRFRFQTNAEVCDGPSPCPASPSSIGYLSTFDLTVAKLAGGAPVILNEVSATNMVRGTGNSYIQASTAAGGEVILELEYEDHTNPANTGWEEGCLYTLTISGTFTVVTTDFPPPDSISLYSDDNQGFVLEGYASGCCPAEDNYYEVDP